jgi:hypothetical protein
MNTRKLLLIHSFIERKATFAGTLDNHRAILFQTSKTLTVDLTCSGIAPSVLPDSEARVELGLTQVVVDCHYCRLEE